jgi:hypothetical protein
VFIRVHPRLTLFVRSGGSVRFLGSSGMPVETELSPDAGGTLFSRPGFCICGNPACSR